MDTERKPDTYKTIVAPSEGLAFKDRKSKFHGYAFPIENEENVGTLIGRIRKRHHAAGHVCYAWRLGTEGERHRANDDGEPNNSAGTPIFGQIQSFGLTNVLVAVARIFGGTKLGKGGLVNAYRSAAKAALDASEITERILECRFLVSFGYAEMNRVMRTIKKNRMNVVSRKMAGDCSCIVSVRKRNAVRARKLFAAIPGVGVKKIGGDF